MKTCRTDRREFFAAGKTATTNIINYDVKCLVPAFPDDLSDEQVSIYFLAFIILKVSYFYWLPFNLSTNFYSP